MLGSREAASYPRPREHHWDKLCLAAAVGGGRASLAINCGSTSVCQLPGISSCQWDAEVRGALSPPSQLVLGTSSDSGPQVLHPILGYCCKDSAW